MQNMVMKNTYQVVYHTNVIFFSLYLTNYVFFMIGPYIIIDVIQCKNSQVLSVLLTCEVYLPDSVLTNLSVSCSFLTTH